MIRNRPAAHIIQLLLPVIVVVLAAPLAVPVGASLSVQEQTVTIMAAGDISPDPGAAKDDDIATSNLILDADPTTVLTLGDNQYPQGQLADYQNRAGYQGSWGRFKAKTRPSPGNHDYADPAGGAAGYFGYFGALAGDPDKGYYSFDLGAWHIIALNSNCGAAGAPSCDRDSPQVRWLQADLQANAKPCTLAYWHHPRPPTRPGMGTRHKPSTSGTLCTPPTPTWSSTATTMSINASAHCTRSVNSPTTAPASARSWLVPAATACTPSPRRPGRAPATATTTTTAW
jgi:hypothetical protein